MLHIPKYKGQNLACWCLCLVTWDAFYLLLSTQLTADLTPKWSGGSMFHPLSHIYTKTPFCCVETLNHRRVVVFDWLWANMTSTLNTAFSLTNVHAKWWIHCLLISSTPLLSHATSIYNQPKCVCGVFFNVFWNNCQIWATWTFSTICVCTTVFKVSIPTLNSGFRQSRVWITLIKPLLCLSSISPSPSENNVLLTHKIQIFPLSWKFATVEL